MEFLANTDGIHRTVQSFGWPCEPIILSIGHFDSLKSNWTFGERLLASDGVAVT